MAEHFRHHLELARNGEYAHLAVADAPDAPAIERIIDAAFWASLRRDEGRTPRISLAFLPQSAAGTALLFERPLPLDPETLTRLAPAVERPGIHLGVARYDGQLCLWGATRTLPPLCFVLEVVQPGLLVVKHRRADPEGKFANVAVLEGDEVKIVDAEGTLASECPEFVAALLGVDATFSSADSVLLPLALSMRDHGHGGSLLVVPHGSDAWRQSILWPVPYAVAPPFSKLGDLLRAAQAEKTDGAWHEAFRQATDAIGGLTAVDGATVVSDRWDVLAFGAKIGRGHQNNHTNVEQVVIREPIVGRAPAFVHPTELGGTRHLSAAQFVHEQRDALALVASQDGRFTVFGWADGAGMVYGYRVEALLL
ncbi:MAG: putative sensor domain DACNV-containing protein [Gemmatimonadales bacterium]